MPKMNNFFNELIQDDYFEKQASENESIKAALGDCSSSVLQKLAEELGALSEEETFIEDQVLDNSDIEEGQEDDQEEDVEKESEEGKKDKGDSGADKEEDKSKEDESKEAETDVEKDKKEKEDDDEEVKEDANEDEEEKTIEKEAYFLAQEKLASSNMSVSDFIFEKCSDEHVAEYISESAEKIASLYDKSSLQIADEIFNLVIDKLN